MLLRTVPRKSKLWEVQCSKCGAIVANVSRDELQALMSGAWGNVLCFDCEGRADEIPEVLLSDKLPYWLIFNSEKKDIPPVCILIDPFRQVRQNSTRIELWKTAFKEFVEDLNKGMV